MWFALAPWLPAITQPPPQEHYPERVYAIAWANEGGTGPVPDGLGRGWLADMHRSFTASADTEHSSWLAHGLVADRAARTLLRRDPTRRGANPHAATIAYSALVVSRWTTREAMTAWLDAAWFGRGAVGIDAGADTWFGRPLDALTDGEIAALLALSDRGGVRPEKVAWAAARVLDRAELPWSEPRCTDL